MDPLNLIREIILNLETAKNLVLKPLNREVLYLQCSCNILDSLKVELNREAFLIWQLQLLGWNQYREEIFWRYHNFSHYFYSPKTGQWKQFFY